MASQSEKTKKKVKYSSAKEASAKQKSGFEWTQLKIPKDLKLFKFDKAQVYRINVIPFTVGKYNPMADEGTAHYERTYYVHTNMGLEERNSYACPLKNWGKKCPVCEKAAQFTREGKDKDTIQAIKAKKRQLWLFHDVTDGWKGKDSPEVQLFETAYYGGRGYKGFGELIDSKITIADEGEPATHFYYLDDEGMTLKISTVEKVYSGNKYYVADEIEFVPRKETYSEDLLTEVPSLDSLPLQIDYEDLDKILNQIGDDEDKKVSTREGLHKGAEKASKNGDDEDVTDESDETEEEESEFEEGAKVTFEYKGKERTGTIKEINMKKGIALVACKDKEQPYSVELEDLVVSDAEEGPEEEDEKPAAKKTNPKARIKDDDEDEDSDDDSDMDDDESEDDDSDWGPEDDEDEESEDEDLDEEDSDEPKKKAKK